MFPIKSLIVSWATTPRPTSVIDYAGKLIRQRLAVIRTQHADPVSPGGESTSAHMIGRKPVAIPCRRRLLPSTPRPSLPNVHMLNTYARVHDRRCVYSGLFNRIANVKCVWNSLTYIWRTRGVTHTMLRLHWWTVIHNYQ